MIAAPGGGARPLPRAAGLVLVLALAAYVAHASLGLGDASLDPLFDDGVATGLEAAAGALCVARALRRPAERLAWLLLGAGILAWAAGSVTYSTLYREDVPPLPSVSDGLWLAFYPATAAALALLARARLARFPASLWLDGLAAAACVAALGLAVLWDPVLQVDGGGALATATLLAYPLGDAVLLALVVGVFALTGWRPGADWLLLGVGIGLCAVADALFLYEATVGPVAGTSFDPLWPASLLLLALAAWQRPPRLPHVDLERLRMLVVPAAFTLLALGLIVADRWSALPGPVYLLALASLVAALGRAGMAVGAGARALARRREEALTDSLTGLANRRELNARLIAEAARAQRHGYPLALAVIDLDHFKTVNDVHGHGTGDAILAEVGRRLGDVARVGELVARAGGEEFAWIMPQTGGEDALLAAERGRRAIAATPMAGGLVVTASIGVCELAQTASGSPEELYRRADEALYLAKERGRDAAVLYAPLAAGAAGGDEGRRRERREALTAIRALARAVDARDPSTLRHSERVAAVAARMAEASGWAPERVDALREAALMHDVGKIGVSDVLLGRRGPLAGDEFEDVKRHPALGAQILVEVLSPEQVEWVLHHHERPDGAGYPAGLEGAAISDGGHLLAVADAWDAMTQGRAYRSPLPADEALRRCRVGAGTQFDAAAVAALERVVARAPEPALAG